MPERPPRSNWSPYLSLAADFGYMLLAAVLLLGGGGYWLDRARGAEVPWFGLTGVLLALAVSFQSLFRGLARLERAERERRAKAREPSRGGPEEGPR